MSLRGTLLLHRHYDASSKERVTKQRGNRLAFRRVKTTAKQTEYTMLPSENGVRVAWLVSSLSAKEVNKL
jgi:hypothetical protein